MILDDAVGDVAFGHDCAHDTGGYGECVTGPYQQLAERLAAIAEELDEIMFDQLREASADKTGRPADDKRLTQARRAIDKATRLLRGGTEEY